MIKLPNPFKKPDSEKEAFQRLLAPEAKKIYEDLGYDFSFIR